ncbi:MAG TPA: PEP-CTERM sorting domain-containing protein [Candidatus Acidoferrales bacterium]|nr:PEP-CTERM sorting domain-containing protein [Candidatus Acidoferrales bacterium]
MEPRVNAGTVGGSGFSMRAIALRLSIAGLALAVAMLALPSRAAADNIVISLQENGGALQQVANGDGSALYIGQFGDYLINSVYANGSPNLTEPNLQTVSLDISSGGRGTDVLNIYVSEMGLTSPSGVNPFVSSFAAALTGNVASVLEQTFIGLPGSGTPLSQYLFTSDGSTSLVANTPNLTGAYNETVQYTITTKGVGGVLAAIQIAGGNGPVNTPEPSTLLLMGLGLGSLLLLGRRRLALSQSAQ